MNLRLKLLLIGALTAVMATACTGNDAFVNADDSSAQDQDKVGGDVQSALSSMAGATVVNVGAAGVPTWIQGDLGKVDNTMAFGPTHPGVTGALAQIAPAFRLSPTDLAVVSSETDELGHNHIRYQQSKNGLRVVGGNLVIHTNEKGVIQSAHGTARDGVSLSSKTSMTEAAAATAAQRGSADVTNASTGKPTLVYILDQKGTMSLAYEVEVTGDRAVTGGMEPVRDLVYVNARTGNVVERHPQIKSAMNREMHNLANGTTLPGPLSRSEGGAAVADAIVNTNYDLLGYTWNCYKTLFNRDSFDNLGAKLISSVHYSTNYVNAYWNSTQMVYGDGQIPTADNLAKSMDVTAHELTHAVTERTANLTYSGESGGINESMSDVFGNVCESFKVGGAALPIQTGTTQGSYNTWYVGEDIWSTTTQNDALRYMNDPARDGSSKDFWDSTVAGVDVHYSSGLGNLAFYLLSQGGTHPRGKSTTVVPAIGIAKAAQIWYRALSVYLTASSNYAAFKTAALSAASDLYGGTASAEYAAVGATFTAIGVGVPPPPITYTTLSNGVALTGQSGSTGGNKYYRIVVPAGQTSLTVVTSGGTGDADMHVKFNADPSTTVYDCRPYAAGNAETCTFTNPAAGNWNIMLNGYSAYSGLSITATYAGGGGGGDPYLTNGTTVTNISGAASSAQYWRLAVPAGQAKVVFTMTGQTGTTGDADLYVLKGARPTTTTYDCRPYLSGNNETCTITAPVAGDYYVMIRGYSAFTAVSLKGQYP